MPGNGHTKALPDLPIEGRRRGGTEGRKGRDVDVRNANEMRTVEEAKRRLMYAGKGEGLVGEWVRG